MTSVLDREDILFQVVVNHEEQYSIWPDYKAVPAGWRTVGKSVSSPEKGMPGLHRRNLD
jgi:MbtH protein